MEEHKKRARVDADSDSHNPNAKLLRLDSTNSTESTQLPETILTILNDDPDSAARDSPSHELDSVIKSFEHEISAPVQPELGFLLEASDDELGLPPPPPPPPEDGDGREVGDSVEFGINWGDESEEYVAAGGLFDFGCDSVSGESLPAL